MYYRQCWGLVQCLFYRIPIYHLLLLLTLSLTTNYILVPDYNWHVATNSSTLLTLYLTFFFKTVSLQAVFFLFRALQYIYLGLWFSWHLVITLDFFSVYFFCISKSQYLDFAVCRFRKYKPNIPCNAWYSFLY